MFHYTKHLFTLSVATLLFGSLAIAQVDVDPSSTAELPQDVDVQVSQPAATMLPDISVIGDIKGYLTNREDVDSDDHLQLDEVEIVLGGGIYPGIRGDVVVAFHGPEYTAELEEGYVTVDQFTKSAPIGGRLGIVRLPFGKVNPVHPHSLPYADLPCAVENLLGDEFIGNGFEVIGAIPIGNKFFLQTQLGRWNPRAHEHHHDGEEEEHHHALGAGFAETFTLARIWAGTEIGANSELEFGLSGAIGEGEHIEDDGLGGEIIHHPDIKLYGADITWRKWLSGERRLLLQAEAIRREEEHDDATHVKSGYYLLGTYRPSNLWEFGTRYDWCEVPGEEGHGSYISLFGTRFLNETTYTRLQFKHGENEENETINELIFQVVFGFGPHAHNLQ